MFQVLRVQAGKVHEMADHRSLGAATKAAKLRHAAPDTRGVSNLGVLTPRARRQGRRHAGTV
jgi:hypothetical protein